VTRARLAHAALVTFAFAAAGCSLGQGEGKVYSAKLYAKDCWFDEYDLQPDFFAAVPFRDTQQIRIQRGSDLEEVSDGLLVLVDDTPTIRQRLGQPICVSLPPDVRPPGSPIGADPGQGCADGPLVHMGLYLQRSCHNQNIVLYAVSGHITFANLFDGDPNELSAEQKYTDATFDDVVVGDPRDVKLGAKAYEIPAEKQTHLSGYFRFYFQRGRPGQPFP
jgi:hypothetical protein